MSNLNDQIKKYLKGELTSSEMHALEKKALHDPFLAEALEGAEQISPKQFSSDLSDLQQKVIVTKSRSLMWPIGIAASTIFVLSLTYFFMLKNADNQKDAIVLNDSKDTETVTQPPALDSSSKDKQTENLLSYQAEGDTEKSKPHVAKPQSVETEEESVATTASGAGAAEQIIAIEETDDVQIAEAEIDEDQISEIADASGPEELKAAEYQTELEKTESRSEAVPQSQSGARAKKQAMAASPSTTDTEPAPEISMEEYKKYLLANVNYPNSARIQNITGEVIISFIVDTDGSLTNFIIEKSLGYGCDEELIRAIKEGPKWLPAMANNRPITKKTTVSFFFHN